MAPVMHIKLFTLLSVIGQGHNLLSFLLCELMDQLTFHWYAQVTNDQPEWLTLVRNSLNHMSILTKIKLQIVHLAIWVPKYDFGDVVLQVDKSFMNFVIPEWLNTVPVL